MRFQRFSVGLAAATLTLSLSSAWAQDERGRPRESEPAAARPSNGDNVGSAVPRGGSSGGETASSSSSTSPSPSNNSPANVAGSSTSWMDPGSSAVSRRAPVRPARADRLDAADQRRGNGGETTGRAVPRGDSGNTASGSPKSTNASSGSESQPVQGHTREVPPNSRPRDGRNQTGTAVERRGPPPNGDGHYDYGYGYPAYGYYPSYVYNPYYSLYYSPYYNGYGYWNPYGYGYGLGYFSYDPFLFGAMGYSSYYGAGGGYAGSGGYPESSSGGGSYVPHYQGAGSLRLKIKPADAKVYIDGYYVGMVDSFDGVFQKLNVDAGPHKVELRADGYQTTEFDVVVTPGDTVTYKGDMKRR